MDKKYWVELVTGLLLVMAFGYGLYWILDLIVRFIAFYTSPVGEFI